MQAMMTLHQITNGSEKAQEVNRRVLQPVLTDLIAYGLLIKQFHWNVTGSNFRAVHLQMDDIYNDVLVGIDNIAERIVACGSSPLGTAKSVAADTEVGNASGGFIADHDVVLLAGQATHELIGLIRSRMDEIETIDTVTADLLHQTVAQLEKHHWMLRVQRIPTSPMESNLS